MKTVLFSGIAATAMLFAANAANASDPMPSGKAPIQYRSGTGLENGLDETDDEPAMRPDPSAYEWSENGGVAFAAPDGSSYSYDGEWDGEYVDPQGRVFEGDWSGRVTRRDGVSGPGYPVPEPRHHAEAPYAEPGHDYDDRDDDYYDVPRGYENYERCLRSNGLKGAAIGALLGGFAGNRIAGRGDWLGGTLVGAGVGGLLGVAVEKASDKCRHFRPGHDRPPLAYHHGYSHGWQGGYYYPQSAATVTVIMSAPVTTTTVTEEIYYETVAAPRKRMIRKWKPKAKPRCVCR